MELFHDSHNIEYRAPFGAVPTGTNIIIRIRCDNQKLDSVRLRLFRQNVEEQLSMELESQTDTSSIYSITISAGDFPCLIWYDFVAEGSGRTIYYSNSYGSLGGVGVASDSPMANSYQITVYDKNYTTPDWFRGQIMYQIFPDRFHRANQGEIPKKRDEYIIHYDLNEPLAFNRHPFEDGPACNDFYGGDLDGIREKLSYLKELGVGVIYLNPIFEAYSNHRYDTANYKAIDPILGNEDSFKRLCKEADSYGIKIILDGVFSHTGADSIYFNKYGSYGAGVGAYQNPDSPYKSWYQFTQYPDYQSWWGCSNLPNVNEMEDGYLDYILRDEDAVVKKWVKNGASGWRLDVADELPDEFIKLLRQELKRENPDAVIIGEVWEDASNKTAYGKQREYLLGYELDSVMNYPFKDQVIDYLMGYIGAETLNLHIMSQLENYPPQTLHSLMNILGTHDTMRIKSLLGGMGDDCRDACLSSGFEEFATKRLMLGAFLQMTFYGVPCIYYGDEIGMQGGRDPFNRGVYPWRKVDTELREWYRMLGKLRNKTECLRRGYFKTLYAKENIYAYMRYFENGVDPFGKEGNGCAICVVNRGAEPVDILIDILDGENKTLKEFIAGGEPDISNGKLSLTMPPLSARLFMR